MRPETWDLIPAGSRLARLVRYPIQPRLHHLVFVGLDGVGVLGCWKIGGAGPAHDAAVASTTVEISLGSAQGASEMGFLRLSDGLFRGLFHTPTWYPRSVGLSKRFRTAQRGSVTPLWVDHRQQTLARDEAAQVFAKEQPMEFATGIGPRREVGGDHQVRCLPQGVTFG